MAETPTLSGLVGNASGVPAGDDTSTFLNRIKDTLRLGGFLVATTVIEEHLFAEPQVRRAQVIGVDVPGTGDVATALVQPVGPEPPDPPARQMCCRERTAAFKVPSTSVVDAFRVTSGPNGDKINGSQFGEMVVPTLRQAVR